MKVIKNYIYFQIRQLKRTLNYVIGISKMIGKSSETDNDSFENFKTNIFSRDFYNITQSKYLQFTKKEFVRLADLSVFIQ